MGDVGKWEIANKEIGNEEGVGLGCAAVELVDVDDGLRCRGWLPLAPPPGLRGEFPMRGRIVSSVRGERGATRKRFG